MDVLTARAIASIAVCGAGAYSMWLTKNKSQQTGIGWAIFGLFLIWS